MPLGNILSQAIPRPLRPQFEAAAKTLKPLSRVQNRLLEPCPEHDLEICFQHSVLCQTGLPYRDPGKDIRHWQRTQGIAMLKLFGSTHRRLPYKTAFRPSSNVFAASMGAAKYVCSKTS